MKIVVNGALGRMGSQVVQQVLQEKDMELAGVVDVAQGQAGGLTVSNDLLQTIGQTAPDVVVDFTKPAVVMDTLRRILPSKVRVVVGTTGFSEQDLAEVDRLARENGTAVMIAPNFALGAVVMMKLAAEAAKYFPNVEIIEKHHDKKLDAPSGTAVMTAKKIAQVRAKMRQGHPEEKETLAGCRGADYEGMKIHSLRLPGYVASQEVIFGGQGETLHISTEPINRECYMPGVMLACRKIKDYTGLVYGLENML
ncbi:MAG: 4-hydroxy-tetrahydrodipicolinate reductase [Acidaminococcaceae bacterium]|nr:4-hydroxy-tetrahydrodipicolinate reductase [Acidaminococcaceae bacterium]